MHCPDCGTFFPDAQAFCLNCGQVLSDGENQAHLGPYRLLDRIGQGGMGMVYRAYDENLGRDVAIKVLHRHLLSDDKQTQRFRREARMHSQLMHANIVTLLDVYDENDTLALVMELIEGCTLKEYLKKVGIPSWPEVVYISNAILAALELAHSQGVVHRDLKLSNVFLCDDGSIKLMDFGLAKTSQPNEDITDSGATVGTYHYMAPEQILGGDIDARTDLYSFGVMLYRMCSGELPFVSTGGGEFEIMEKQVRQTPVRPEKINAKIPKELDGLIMDLLQKIPDERPESCAVVRQRLAGIASPRPPSVEGMRFSDLHVELQKMRQRNRSNSRDTASTSEDDEQVPQNCLLWAFRHCSAEAPDEAPLDLRSPPPIEREHLQGLKQAIQDIPPLPDNWNRIERILNDPESAPADLAREIEHDPVLSAHILSLANSAAFALPGQKVENVAIAIARLGMDNIQDFLMQKLLPEFGNMHPESEGIIAARDEMRQIVCHSMAVALIFRQLSDYGQIVAHRSASLFGMMHDIGKLVILHKEDGETLQQLRIAIADGVPALKAEWDTLGYTHIDAGMMLALHWKLPRIVHRFIYFHHHPAWHAPDVWPVDMQPAIMLNHMAHIALQALEDIPGLAGGIWSPERRTHLRKTESLLRQPLRLPLKDTSHFQQIRQNVERLASTFDILYPVSET